MNFHDSERMSGLLDRDGYEPADSAEDADLIVVNTCSVRERAEDKLYTRLGELRQLKARGRGPTTVAVAGCVAQQEGAAILARDPVVDVVIGTQSAKRLPLLVDEALQSRMPVVDIDAHEDVSFPLGVARRRDPVKAYITIIEGCNDFCTFCVVPYTRGRERMRPVREILDEARRAADSGHKEVHLLGQIVNHYQAPDEPACDFARLLERLDAIAGIERIRFASPHPRHVSERMIAAVRDLPKVCKHLHLPVQSGSTRVLAAMRRRHGRDEYLDLVARIRSAVPNIALSTDMIVGFPGETARDFDDTLSLVSQVRFHGMFSFKYSPRPRTRASRQLADDVGPAEKTRRIVALQALQRDIQLDLHQRVVGTRQTVLTDSRSRRRDWELSGRTTGNTVVNFQGPAELGQEVWVHIKRAGPYSLWGLVGGASSLGSDSGVLTDPPSRA